jgi:hypothetical protein
MNRTFRIVKLIFLVLSMLACLAIPAVGLVSTAVNYQGVCPGFTDGQAPCPWWMFARNEMFWASFIFIPLLFLAAVAWLVMAAVQFITSLKNRKNNPATKVERDLPPAGKE